jgi:hypothetical protein
MQRRKALQAIVFFSVVANTFISCKNKSELIGKLGLKNLDLDTKEVDQLESIVKAMFPTENSDLFKGQDAFPHVLSMVDRLYTKADRESYIKGLSAFNKLAKDKLGSAFIEASSDKKLSLLKELNSAKDGADKDLNNFFNITKTQTLHYFSTTEAYMRKVMKYEMAPGRVKSCINISEIKSEIK